MGSEGGAWTPAASFLGEVGAAGPLEGGRALTGRRMKNMVRAPTIGTSPRRGSRMIRSIPWSWGDVRCDTPPMATAPHPASSPYPQPHCPPRAGAETPPSPACLSPPPCRRTSSPPRRSGHHPRSCRDTTEELGGCLCHDTPLALPSKGELQHLLYRGSPQHRGGWGVCRGLRPGAFTTWVAPAAHLMLRSSRICFLWAPG